MTATTMTTPSSIARFAQLWLVLFITSCGNSIGVQEINNDRDFDGFDSVVSGGTDCNDSNPDVHPDAMEACDNQDNDCDGLIDCEDDLLDRDGDGVCVCDDCDDDDPLNFAGNPEVCDGQDNDCDGFADCVDPDVPDADGDGACVCTDCDDADGANFPGNLEACDGVDNDCDGTADDNVSFLDWYQDLDGDGYGDDATLTNLCNGPPGSGWVLIGGDCDDDDDANHPNNGEICDGQDNDCDDLADEGLFFTDLYFDGDADGYGDTNTTQNACPGLLGTDWVVFEGDCDDDDAAVNPGAVEICDGKDNDCQNGIDCDDPSVPDADADGYCVCDDCQDRESWNFPGNPEVCDGHDNNCDTLVDCNDPTVPDGDGDGVCSCQDCDDNDAANFPNNPEIFDGQDNDCDGFSDCIDPDVPDGDNDGVCEFYDCDDADPDVYPGNRELCDGKDNDCDEPAQIDEGLAFVDWYADTDGDGRGDAATKDTRCDAPTGSGWVQVGDDCDDNDPKNFPFNNEACDQQDNNCNGLVDENLLTQLLYEDTDGDGHGNPAVSQPGCLGGAGSGWVTLSDDCDDTNGAISPSADEACFPLNVDDDCDTLIDCDDPEVQDADGDGFCVCEDCNDLENWNFPNNPEICDGRDNDCDTLVDCQDSDIPDADNDGFCACPDSDCDDNDGANFPGNTEICDSQDNDCDGKIDCIDPDVPDGDGDGTCVCFDCDDSDAAAFPGNVEACDGVDNDCLDCPTCTNGVPDAETTDFDGDGWVECDDCDDADANTYPGAPELCDGIDNDCNGSLPLDELDSDRDGYLRCVDCDDFDPTLFEPTPDADGDGYDECTNDCDLTDGTINPGAVELCDYLDNNCDGKIDEIFLTGGRYEGMSNCGSCGNDCTTYGFDNATPQCDTSLLTPRCTPDCDPGYYDANNDDLDGCECLYLSAIDMPYDGTDADCSGDDGDHTDAIHVALWGSPTGTGTITDPLRSVQAGVDKALADTFAYVLVSQGAYYESVDLDPGISLIGGYSFFFEEYEPVRFETVIDGRNTTPALPGAVNVFCTSTLTQRIQGLTVLGTLPDGPGESSYGVYLLDCEDSVSVVDNLITSRPGADGSDGDYGAHGTVGTDGLDGGDAGFTDCAVPPAGGLGGMTSCAVPSRTEAIDGGDGGGTFCPIVYAQYTDTGAMGLGSAGGAGGDAASHCRFQGTGSSACTSCTNSADFGPGGVGAPGRRGAHGVGGLGCALDTGMVSGNLFTSVAGAPGETAFNGSGGGGGGAGAGAEVGGNKCGSLDVTGGTGGGGGSGGCGAQGGLAGTGGGGSFGLFLTFTTPPASLPVLDRNIVESGVGGEGGWGGSGGVGGIGGLGGFGGLQGLTSTDPDNVEWAGRTGGDGGNGGAGGHGGGGGGGCGGVSFALFVSGTAPAASYGTSNTLLFQGGGLGGTGGYGPGGTSGNPGLDGAEGTKSF